MGSNTVADAMELMMKQIPGIFKVSLRFWNMHLATQTKVIINLAIIEISGPSKPNKMEVNTDMTIGNIKREKQVPNEPYLKFTIYIFYLSKAES